MPDPRRATAGILRRGLSRLIVASGASALALLALATPARADTVAGVDIDATVAALGDDRVAILQDTRYTDAQFAGIVSEARSGRIALSVVVTGDGVITGEPTAVADAVRGQVHGTVLVITPGGVALSSDSVGEAEIRAAVDSAAGDQDAVAAAQSAVDSLTETPFPWTLVIIGGIAVLVIGGLAGGLWERYRHRRDTADAYADLAEGLQARVVELAPVVEELSTRANATGRQDLDERCEQATADHASLREHLSHPLESRRAVNVSAHQVNELTDRLIALDREIDRAVPGSGPEEPGQPRS